MNWTKEIPTIDGWYWVRSKGEVSVELVKDSCYWSYVWEGWEKLCDNHGWEFYGPLEEPK